MGATYTRQSSYSDGDTIQAADTNNEFNQILAAFASGTGHTHDGTTAEGGPITKLLGTSITIGDATSGTDITVTFDGETSDGVITWMEDEDQFKFSDDIMIVDDEQLIFGTDSNVAISYDETTTDSLKIAATEGAGLAITLMADEGDDAGDEWKLNIADGGTLTLGNDINSAGTYVTHLTIAPNATVASSTLTYAGNLTVGGNLSVSGTTPAASSVAADDISTGDAAVNILTSSGNVLVDSQAGATTVDGHTGVTLQSTNSGDITLDSVADIVLDAGGADITLKDDGTTFGALVNSSGELVIKSGSTPTTALTFAGDDATFADNVSLASDSAVLKFGGDSDVTVTHVADTGLTIKQVTDADDKPMVLTLQTGETDIAANDVLGRIDFQAPDETTGTDAILVAAGIAAISEGDFSSSSNATKLSFRTAASEAAAEKMSLSSGGNLTISGDLTVTGDDIFLNTNTDTAIMVADGTNYNPVVPSGDVTLTNAGVFGIASDVIVNADINSSAAIADSKLAPISPADKVSAAAIQIDGATDGTGITIAAGDKLLVDDGGTTKYVEASQLNTYVSAEASAIAADNITTGDGAVSLETSSGNVLVDSQAGTATVDGHTGVTIQSSNSGDITLDSVADINLDAGGADIVFKDDGTTFGSITNSGGEVVIKSGSTPTTALTFAGNDVNFADNVQLDSDAAELLFGDDGEIKLIHNADAGLLLKHTATGDGTPVSLTLQTGETALTVGEPLGTINFQAPDEAGGTDAILISAAIEAVAEDTFAADNNATKLSFKTGASEAAAEKMSISSVGNVTMKNTATGDDTPITLTLQSGETDIAINDVIGKIDFQAPDESTGTDAILVAAGIEAVSEGDFSSSNNATKLSFKTGASEAAAEKMSLSSAGLLTIADDFMLKDGGTIGVASANDAMTISSAGIVTFKDDILIKDGGTIGVASSTDAMTVASTGIVTFVDDILIKDGGTIGVASTADALTLSSAGLLTVKDDLVIKSGGTIGGGGDTDLLTLGSAILTVAGEISVTTLDIGGTDVGSTAAELNLLDGSAKSTSSITIADDDAIIVIDGTTTKQIPASDMKTYAGGVSTADATALAVALG